MGSALRGRASMGGRPIVLQDTTALAATTPDENVLEKTRIVQMPRNGMVSLYICGDAIGLRARFSIGENDVLLDSAVNFANRYPETDKDGMFFRVPARSGDRLTLYLNNPTAGALNAYWRVVVE